MRELYREAERILRGVNFEESWKDFHPCRFALYDEQNVYFSDETIPCDHRFLGNTSIDYNGERIAIWKADDPRGEDVERLAANIVHESFHAFQSRLGEKRYPNDLILLDYPCNEENYRLKFYENNLLAQACEADDRDEKREIFGRFIASRKYREAMFGEMIRQEYLAETLEGMAEYAGSMALKQISDSKFADRMADYRKKLRAADDGFFDIRRISYFSGTLICMVLKDLEIDFYHRIGAETDTTFEIVSKGAKAVAPNVDESMEFPRIDLYISNKKQKFGRFLSGSHTVTEGVFSICGYDPMNMIKVDDMILCSRFVMLKKSGDEKLLHIEGPVLLHMIEGSLKDARSYVK